MLQRISFVLGTLRFNNNLSIVDNLAGAFAKVAVKGRRGDPSAITKVSKKNKFMGKIF